MNTIISENKSYFISLLTLLMVGIYPLVFVSKADSFFFINGHYSLLGNFIFKYLTYLGSGYIYLLVFICFLLKKDYKVLFLITGTIILQTLLSTLLKQVIFPNAWRPTKELADMANHIHLINGVKLHRYHSFPSGHTATAFAIFTLLAMVVKNKKYSLIFLLMATGVAWSRVYLAQHFLIDVYFGAITGVLSSMVIYGWFMNKTPYFMRKFMKHS